MAYHTFLRGRTCVSELWRCLSTLVMRVSFCGTCFMSVRVAWCEGLFIVSFSGVARILDFRQTDQKLTPEISRCVIGRTSD
jgi:hypothetical protein